MSQRPKWLQLILVSLAWSMPGSIATSPWTGYQSIAGLHPPLGSMSLVPIFTPRWGKTTSKVPCLRKQHNGPSLNPGPPDPEFEVLTAKPHMPPYGIQVLWVIHIQRTVNFQQLKGMHCCKQGLWMGYHLSIEVVQKGYPFCQKWYIKG